MLGRMLSKMLIVVVVLTALLVVPVCVLQRQRAVNQIETVSKKFVGAASRLDLMALRECLTSEGRASMPAYYTCVASGKLRELNRDVRANVRLQVIDVRIGAGQAETRIRRDVTEHGRRLGKPVNIHIQDECTVVCVYNGERWLVDLDRTLRGKQSPAANLDLFRECRVK